MRLVVVFAFCALAACAGLDVPAVKGYDNIRAAVEVKTDPATGVTSANSRAAAKEEVYRPLYAVGMDASGQFDGGAPSKRARSKFYAEAEKAADGTVRVYFVSDGETPVIETELQEKPWTEKNPDSHGFVGDPWRKVYWELVEWRTNCDTAKLRCLRIKKDRMKLSNEDVRVLLAEGRDEIRVSFREYRTVSTQLDIDQLAAVLDALGVREQFQPAS